MPRDAVSRTANVERNGGHKWVKKNRPLILQHMRFERLGGLQLRECRGGFEDYLCDGPIGDSRHLFHKNNLI